MMDDGTSTTIGRRLGPYQLTARIGVGGMGEVYRARDTKLGRDVAVKIHCTWLKASVRLNLRPLASAPPPRLSTGPRMSRVIRRRSSGSLGYMNRVTTNDRV